MNSRASKFFFIAFMFAVPLAELTLFLAAQVSKSSWFIPLGGDDSNKPISKSTGLRIAVFGGSAASGYSSERNFAQVIEHELKNKYGSDAVIVKNFAQNGQPFHRHQVEIAKKVIDDYDLLVFYVGTNEPGNYIDDVGYYRRQEFKLSKKLEPPGVETKDAQPAAVEFIKRKSRLYSLGQKLQQRFKEKFIARLFEPNVAYLPPVKELALERIMPEGALHEMLRAFERDLRELTQLAERKNKKILISNEPTNELAPPSYSLVPKGFSEVDTSEILKRLHDAKDNYQSGRRERAEVLLKAILGRAPQLAMAHFILGHIYLDTGKRTLAYAEFRKSIDGDGLMSRGIGPLFQIEKDVAREHPQTLSYIDSINLLHEALQRGLKYEKFFADIQHPTLLGHALLGLNFVCEIEKIQNKTKPQCEPVLSKNNQDLDTYYRKVLGVTKEEEQEAAYTRTKWNTGMASHSANPDFFIKLAKRYLKDFQSKSSTDSADRAKFLLGAFFIADQEHNSKQAYEHLSQALSINRGYTRYVLELNQTPSGEALSEVLKRNRIKFSYLWGRLSR